MVQGLGLIAFANTAKVLTQDGLDRRRTPRTGIAGAVLPGDPLMPPHALPPIAGREAAILSLIHI